MAAWFSAIYLIYYFFSSAIYYTSYCFRNLSNKSLKLEFVGILGILRVHYMPLDSPRSSFKMYVQFNSSLCLLRWLFRCHTSVKKSQKRSSEQSVQSRSRNEPHPTELFNNHIMQPNEKTKETWMQRLLSAVHFNTCTVIWLNGLQNPAVEQCIIQISCQENFK